MTKKVLKKAIKSLVKEEILATFGKEVAHTPYFSKLVQAGVGPLLEDRELKNVSYDLTERLAAELSFSSLLH